MKYASFALIGIFVVASARADDWPQFRGPNRDGISKEKGFLKAWPKDGPKVLWTYKDAGLGFSSVAVSKGVVYTLGTDMKFTHERIIAIDEKTGQEKWSAKLGAIFTFKGNTWGDGPRSTPTLDGNLLFALCAAAAGELVCVDISKNGAEVWRKNFKKDFGGAMMSQWGYSESPLVDGDHLICTPGGAAGTMCALNKKTGALVWRTKDWAQQAVYSSPIVADIQGVRQYIQCGYEAGKDSFIAGIQAKDGKVLWKMPYFNEANDYLAPSILAKNNEVYVTSGAGQCQLFAIDAKQTATAKYGTKQKKVVKNSFGGVVEVGGYIFGHTEPKAWVCQELKTGNPGWRNADDLNGPSGSIIAADGKLYLYSDAGEVGLVDADPKENFVSSFTIPKKSDIPANRPTSARSQIWAHPAIANGVLYLRDHEFIFAFDISGGKK